MRNLDTVNVKKANRAYWGQNPPGLDESPALPGSPSFYAEIDAKRYQFEPYIPTFIRELAKHQKLGLEVGCGLGSDSREFARQGVWMVSMDLSLENVQRAKKGFEVLGLRGHFVAGDAEHLPFRDKAFDLVYSYGVLHHTTDTAGAIRELFRILKNGGKSLVMLYHKGLAYHLILFYRLLTLQVFRISREQFLSLHYDHTPLSKMFSKREAHALFANSDDVTIRCISFGGVQNHNLLKWYYLALTHIPFLMNYLGSFLIITGRKLRG